MKTATETPKSVGTDSAKRRSTYVPIGLTLSAARSRAASLLNRDARAPRAARRRLRVSPQVLAQEPDVVEVRIPLRIGVQAVHIDARLSAEHESLVERGQPGRIGEHLADGLVVELAPLRVVPGREGVRQVLLNVRVGVV